MRILVFHQFLWAHYKAGIYTELNKLCVINDIYFHVVHLSTTEKTRKILGDIDTSIHQYPYTLLFDLPYEETSFVKRIFSAIGQINLHKPDVINFPGYYEPAMWFVQFYARLKGIKIILSNDSTEFDNPKVWWKETIKKVIVSMSSGFFCFGTRSANYAMKLGAKKEQILSRLNAVDNDRILEIAEESVNKAEFQELKSKLPKYNFIFVGRFVPQKNLCTLLRAFAKLKNRDDWGLILMGGGEEQSKIDGIIGEYHLENAVHFLEPSDWKGVAANFHLGDVFVLSSVSESWGLVVNEAMVCSKPVIVSNQCGCSEDLVKNGKNGFIFDALSDNDLMEKMQFFVDHSDQIKSFGAVSKEIINAYTSENVAKEMFEGYKMATS